MYWKLLWKSRNNKIRFSLLTRIMAILILMAVIVVSVLLFISLFVRYRLRMVVMEIDRDIISRQMQSIDTWLRQDENFLITIFQENADINALRRGIQPESTANHVFAIKQLFINRQAQGNASELYFVLLKEKRQSCFSLEGSFTSDEKDVLEKYFNELELTQELKSQPWTFIQLEDNVYCLRYICRDGVCIGGLIRASSILSEIYLEDGTLALLDSSGNLIVNGKWMEEHAIDLKKFDENSYLISGKPERYLILEKKFTVIDGTLLFMISDGLVLGKLKYLITLSAILSFFAGVMIFVTIGYFYNVLSRSLNCLKSAIVEMKEENLESRIIIEHASREFGEVYDLFNEMADKIKFFRIKSYEEELDKKRYQLQFYSLQIKPHFYLNSLKFLYALAQKQDYHAIQRMLLELSDYYQFVTYDSEKLIALEEELRHTATYIMIREAGVEKHTDCILEIDNRARSCLVPGLCVQTFVENSLKYSGLLPEELKISISVKVQEEDSGQYVRIVITDNGAGYSEEVIKAFQENDHIELEGHVGLSNLWHRMELIYGKPVVMVIDNKAQGGAYSEIVLPV